MTIETPKVEENNTTLQYLLSENHKKELKEILALGEKYNKEGEDMKNDFWKEHDRKEFVNLIRGYKECNNINRFVEGLEEKEREIINRLNEIEKKKFFNEYLKDRILYSGDIEKKYDENKIERDSKKYKGVEGLKERAKEWKNKLQPGMSIDLKYCHIGSELAVILAKEWKDKLQPGMSIDLAYNELGSEGIEILARERKNSLQPGMNLDLSYNDIGEEGIEMLIKEWKNSLQPGMSVSLIGNKIGSESVAIIAKERKNSLQPGMVIDLGNNNIGAEGVATLAKERKDCLQPGMEISLNFNHIGDEGVKIIAKEWKNSLKSGMKIKLSNNQIGAYGVKILAKEWKDSLQPGMYIDLGGENVGYESLITLAKERKNSLQPGMKNIGINNVDLADAIMELNLKEGVIIDIGKRDINISNEDKKEIEKWVQSYKDKGINCEVYC